MCTAKVSNNASPERPESGRCHGCTKCQCAFSTHPQANQRRDTSPQDAMPSLLQIMADTPDPAGFQQATIQFQDQIKASEH